MKIPIYKLEFEEEYIIEYKARCEEILKSGRPLSESFYVREFEQKFARMIGAKYAVATTSGTAALDLAIRALGIKGKIAIPSNTFFATALAALNNGCDIALVDCERETFSISPEHLYNVIKTNDISAVIVVHIGGIISRYIEDIIDICKKSDIVIIEDAAHAHFSRRGRFKAGTIGEIGCFSFFPTKVMTTGEGGIVVTNNVDLYNKIRSLKNLGRDIDNEKYCINRNGVNYKISEFTAVLGLLELSRVKKRIEKRNILVKRYIDNLCGTGYTPVTQDNGYCSYYKFITLVPNEREIIREQCEKNGISLTGEVYRIPLHRQPAFKNEAKASGRLHETDYVADNHICPPLYPELTLEEVDYICDVLKQAEKI